MIINNETNRGRRAFFLVDFKIFKLKLHSIFMLELCVVVVVEVVVVDQRDF